jgi:hypothetical protein
MPVNQVRDPMRDDARLSAACSGEDQEWTVDVRRSFTLLRV